MGQLNHYSYLFWPFIQSEKFEKIKGISGILGCYFVYNTRTRIPTIGLGSWKSNGELCGEVVKRHSQLGIVT